MIIPLKSDYKVTEIGSATKPWVLTRMPEPIEGESKMLEEIK